MTFASLENTALVIAAHGERSNDTSNDALLAHTAEIARRCIFRCVRGGVLKGSPSIEDALTAAYERSVEHTLIYPLFMSDGYFVRQVLPRRIETAGVQSIVSLLPPLGLDAGLPQLLLKRSAAAARNAGYEQAITRLLVVGHGSQVSRYSAAATKRIATCLRRASRFKNVETAYLEEAPFVHDSLKSTDAPTVVAGFFFGEGMHATHDVPNAIKASGSNAIYTGPIGADQGIPKLICLAITKHQRGRG